MAETQSHLSLVAGLVGYREGEAATSSAAAAEVGLRERRCHGRHEPAADGTDEVAWLDEAKTVSAATAEAEEVA